MDIEELTQGIKSFSFNGCESGGRGYERILLQLFGFLGHGKSSFINSCKYVLDDEDYVNYAGANMSDTGRTTARISYKLTDSITLVDNRGCEKMDSYETGEIFAQLGNVLPLDVPVERSRGLRLIGKTMDAETEVGSSDFICPVFLYSIKKGIHPEEEEDIKKLLQTAERLTGTFPLVVLTHKTYGRLTQIEDMFRNMGVERIFALDNYTPEDHCRSRGKHEAILKLLYEVIKLVRFSLKQPQDRIQEVKDRKQSIQRIICDMYKWDRVNMGRWDKKDMNSQDQADMARWDETDMDNPDQADMDSGEWADRWHQVDIDRRDHTYMDKQDPVSVNRRDQADMDGWDYPVLDCQNRADMDGWDHFDIVRQNWCDMDRQDHTDMDRQDHTDMDRQDHTDMYRWGWVPIHRQERVKVDRLDHSDMDQWDQTNMDSQNQVGVDSQDEAYMHRGGDQVNMDKWDWANMKRQGQVDVNWWDKADMHRGDQGDMDKWDKADMDKKEERRHHEEEIKNLTEKYELQRQCDQRRYEAEIREYQRILQQLKKKSHCVLQ